MSDWNEAEDHVEKAHEFYELGRWEEAEAELRKAIALNPDQAEWHFNLGLTLEAAGRLSEAVSEFEESATLEPDNPQPLVNLGVNLNRLGKPSAALEYLQKAVEIAPDFEAAYCPQITSLAMLDRHNEAEEVFYLARLYRDECPVCFAHLGESLLARREFDRAIWCFKEAARLDPRMERIHARMASVYAMRGQYEQAHRLYLRDLREDPGSIDTLLDLGELFMVMGRLPDASEKFRRVLELEPTNVEAHFRLGQLAVHTRRFDAARIEFELVRKLDAEYPGVPRQIATILVETGDLQAACRQLKSVMESFTHDEEEDLAGLAELLVRVGMIEDACLVLRRLTGNEPDNAEAWHHLGTALLLDRQYPEGIHATRKALRLAPEHPRAIHNLLLAMIESGQFARGLAVLRKAERRIGRDAAIHRLAVRLRTLILRRLAWGFVFRISSRLLGLFSHNKARPSSNQRRPSNL